MEPKSANTVGTPHKRGWLRWLAAVAHQLPAGRGRVLARFGAKAGQPNVDFLNADRSATVFLKPCEEIRSKVGVLINHGAMCEIADRVEASS